MNKVFSISEIVDDIYASILASSRKQRRIRSSSFWKKFRFKRRTKERIESVKKELAAKGLEYDLEESLFGSEKRDQLIAFRLFSKQTEKNTDLISKDAKISDDFKFEEAKERLNHLTEVEPFFIGDTEIFSIMFREFFCIDTPNYEIYPNVFGATRSNWTYHTAGVISQTCKALNLTCKFESLGKRDAVIETRDENSEIVLIAEWEWDYNDVFGAGKELDKLQKSCRIHQSAQAFLLTYCPNSKYLNYLEKIADFWISETKSEEDAPALFLHVVIFEEKSNYREFQKLNSVTIHQTGIHMWDERYL